MGSPTGTPSHDRHGRVVAGRYRLGELLGSGGMASVYRAEDEFLGRTVAIKLFHADLNNAGDKRRQAEEISMLASLNHPALVTLFDAGRDSEDSFLVMEYVDGVDLRTRLGSSALNSRVAALIGADIAAALAHIHARGVVHRDVKPANILLPAHNGASGAPHAKLADFGIARLIDSTRLTATGTMIGTAAFLSPEQAGGREVTAPTDIYSLALVLLESLTGQRAFPGTAVESTVGRLARDPEIPASIGPAWGELLQQTTTREPDQRPGADEFAARLRSLGKGDSTLVIPFGEPDATVRLAPADTPTERLGVADTPTERLAAPGSGHRFRRPAAIAAIAAVAAVVASIAVGGALNSPEGSADPSPDTTVQYPAVEGDLGTHLVDLQESVEP